jgi:hypothetical protein
MNHEDIFTREDLQTETLNRTLGLYALNTDSQENSSSEVFEHPNGYERQYTGVCDVTSPDDVRRILAQLKESRADPNRRLMVGIMTHPAVINPDAPLSDEVRAAIKAEFPAAEDIASAFIDDPDVMNTIHYADLYGPDGPRKAGEAPDLLKNLELCVEYGGDYLDAIQLDLVWPDPDALGKFRANHPDIELVLQLGKFSFGDSEIDVSKVIDNLNKYDKIIDHVLLDLSMGKGRQMTDSDVEELKKLMRVIQDSRPDIGLAVAGGLGAESETSDSNSSVYSMNSLREISKDFPGISIDAQGGLKAEGTRRDDNGHFIATAMADADKSVNYVCLASEILDGPLNLGPK